MITPSKNGMELLQQATNRPITSFVIMKRLVLLTTGKITEPTKITVPKDGTSGKRGIYDLYETNFIKNASGDHAITLQPELYEMYAGCVNPADENDIDDGYRPWDGYSCMWTKEGFL